MSLNEIIEQRDDATKAALAACTVGAFALQAISLQHPFEPENAIDRFDNQWKTDSFPDPAEVYHRLTRSHLQAIGDLLVAIRSTVQPDRNILLIATGTLSRSVVEYSARATYLAAAGVSLPDRILRAVGMLRDGFDNAGGRNTRSHPAVKETAQRFYSWYQFREKELTSAYGPPGQRFNSGNNARQKDVLGHVFQEAMYPHLSDISHGNSATVLSFHDATRFPGNDRVWTHANSIGRIAYALSCAINAADSVLAYTDPSDHRSVGEIVPNAKGSEIFDRTPRELIGVAAGFQKSLAVHLSTLAATLEEASPNSD